MVLIEAEQKGDTVQVQRTVRREETVEVPQQQERDVLEDVRNVWKKFVSLFTNTDFRTVGLAPHKKAEFYVKLCWNQMANNEVGKAKKTYSKLLDAYENLEEGPIKTNIYHEVHDIYQRIAQV